MHGIPGHFQEPGEARIDAEAAQIDLLEGDVGVDGVGSGYDPRSGRGARLHARHQHESPVRHAFGVHHLHHDRTILFPLCSH